MGSLRGPVGVPQWPALFLIGMPGRFIRFLKTGGIVPPPELHHSNKSGGCPVVEGHLRADVDKC